MTTIGDRLREGLRDIGKKAPWLAKQVGLSKSAVYQWLDGSVTKIAPENLIAAAEALGVRVEWLGRGDLPKHPRKDVAPGVVPHLSTVPIVGNTQGGPGREWFELGYPAGYGEEWVDTPAKNESCYALRVIGGSMAPRMREGDAVTVDPMEPPMPGDDVIVRMTDGEVLVKQLAFEREGVVALDSLSEPRLLRRRDQMEFMHLVIGIHPARAIKNR